MAQVRVIMVDVLALESRIDMTSDPLIGKQLGDYRIVDILGRGGMAHVYRGFDKKLQRYAAVKVIDAHLLSSNESEEEYRARFQREARAIAHLNHPNIVGVYQFGEVGPLYYMAMAFIEGRDLGHILKDHAEAGTAMPHEQVIQIIRDISAALDHAHKLGVIHRDIKPSNIMVTSDGRAVLTDFGLALSVPEGSMGNTFGSAHYIAPEQAISSAKAVPQSDLYSLGIVLFQMLTGRVPFDDPSAMSVALMHLSEPPPTLRQYNTRISSAVEKVVLKALEKEPSKRYRTGEVMADALEEALLGSVGDPHLASHPSKSKLASGEYRRFPIPPSSPSSPISLPKPPTTRQRISPVLLGFALLIIVLVVVVVVVILSQNGSSTPTPTAEAVVAAVTSTSVQPTRTRTPASAVTTPEVVSAATEEAVVVEPTPTPRSTITPTALITESVTEAVRTAETTAEITAELTGDAATPGAAWVNLIYNADEFVMINQQSVPVDMRGLVFVQTLSNGQVRTANADNMTDDLDRIRLVRENDCLHLWRLDLGELLKPDYCRARQGFRAIGVSRQFWVSTLADATFEVRRNNVVLQVCLISAGECRVPLWDRQP